MKKLTSLFLVLVASISLMATEGALKGRFTINDAGDKLSFRKAIYNTTLTQIHGVLRSTNMIT